DPRWPAPDGPDHRDEYRPGPMAPGSTEHAPRTRSIGPPLPRQGSAVRWLSSGRSVCIHVRWLGSVHHGDHRPGRVPSHAPHRRRPRRPELRNAVSRLRQILPFIALAAVLAIGVPLFLRTPVWVDVTYHDLSSWNVLHGGVHYRDVFETNLPGMVWLHCLVRPIVGWSHEAIRIVDLFVVGTVVLILTRLMKQSGITLTGRAWFAVAAA